MPPKWAADKRGAIEIEFKKRPKRPVRGLAVFPKPDGELSKEWAVQYRPSTVGRWKPVKRLVTMFAPMSRKPAKDKKAMPIAVEFRFAPVRARQFRLIPKTKSSIQSVLVTAIGDK